MTPDLIRSASFFKSSAQLRQCPPPDLPEYAFIGRSNVGKSSLINMLTARKKLAKTSATPGKTQLINHYLINNAWYLVDLPGYGWSKVSKSKKANWEEAIRQYLLGRKSLTLLFTLIDIRHPAQDIDVEFIQWAGEHAIPLALVFTKADKQSANKNKTQIKRYMQVLKKTWEAVPPYFITSSAKRQGREEILMYIQKINQELLT